MQVIAQKNGYTISSNFGRSVLEGTSPSGSGPGSSLWFEVIQSPRIYSNAWVEIAPLTGRYSDFWDSESNRIGGEPHGGPILTFVSLDGKGIFGLLDLTLNADNIAESDGIYAIRVYDDLPAFSSGPVVEATFTIRDDDRLATQGNDTIWRGNGSDIVAGFGGNDVISSGGGNDQLSGDAGNDTLRGEAGDDMLYGGAGDDSLDGGAGNDTLIGGMGNDTLVGGAGIDTAIYSGGSGARVHLGYTTAQNTWHGSDVLSGIENLTGGASMDVFLGNTAANVLRGEAGNDQLYGGGGNDTVYGGDGNDYLHGGADADWAVFSGPQAVVVEMRKNVVTGQGNDTVAGIENIETGSGNDRIIGNAHRNELKGGAGNDTIEGGGGPDLLTGGAGADRFVFADYEGNDIITDFQDGIDRIIIDSNRIDDFSDFTISNWSGGAVVSWVAGSSIVLAGISKVALSDADFIFE